MTILIFPTQALAASATATITKNMGLSGSTFLFAQPGQLADGRFAIPQPTDQAWLAGVSGYTVADGAGLVAFNEIAGPTPAVPVPKPFTADQVISWLGFTPYSTANPSSFQTPDQVAAAAVAMMKPKLGAITASGHTQTPVSVTTGPIAVGGTTLTVSGVTDPVSGVQPGVGAMVFFRPSGNSDFPANILVSAVCTAPGVVSVRAMPVGGLALGTTTLVGNIFWIW